MHCRLAYYTASMVYMGMCIVVKLRSGFRPVARYDGVYNLKYSYAYQLTVPRVFPGTDILSHRRVSLFSIKGKGGFLDPGCVYFELKETR